MTCDVHVICMGQMEVMGREEMFWESVGSWERSIRSHASRPPFCWHRKNTPAQSAVANTILPSNLHIVFFFFKVLRHCVYSATIGLTSSCWGPGSTGVGHSGAV